MTASQVLTLRLDGATTKRLAKLAAATDRTRSHLASEAIARYLDDHAWQVEAIEEGIAAAERGEVLTHAQVLARVKAWTAPRQPRRRR